MHPRPDFLSPSPFSPIFFLNLRKKGIENPRKTHPFHKPCCDKAKIDSFCFSIYFLWYKGSVTVTTFAYIMIFGQSCIQLLISNLMVFMYFTNNGKEPPDESVCKPSMSRFPLDVFRDIWIQILWDNLFLYTWNISVDL